MIRAGARPSYFEMAEPERAELIERQVEKRFGVSARARTSQPLRSTPLDPERSKRKRAA